MGKFLTQDEFVQRAATKHNNKYNYDNTIYVGIFNKVKITCPIHGDFLQNPNNHLQGKGCSLCKRESISSLFSLSIEKFIEKAKALHGNRYDYSKVIYKNNSTKICVVCEEHGQFWQTPNAHLSGKGCPYCRNKNTSIRFKSNLNLFIEKSNILHNNKYIYSKTVYTGTHKKVIIICPDHGEFKQLPSSHLQKHGCPVCNSSTGELAIKNILDKNNIKYKQEYIIPEIVSLLRYDFYLPDYNILIEFHGKQHYEYNPFFHCNGEDDFLKQKDRDMFKRDHAIRFKYRLLEFNYKHLEEINICEFENLVITKINKNINRLNL